MCSCKYEAGKVQPFMTVLTRFLVYQKGRGRCKPKQPVYFRKDLTVKVIEMTEDLNTLRPTRGNDSGTTGP